MSAEVWSDRAVDLIDYTEVIADVVRELPGIVHKVRLVKSGDTGKEHAAEYIFDRLDAVLTAAWGDE